MLLNLSSPVVRAECGSCDLSEGQNNLSGVSGELAKAVKSDRPLFAAMVTLENGFNVEQETCKRDGDAACPAASRHGRQVCHLLGITVYDLFLNY